MNIVGIFLDTIIQFWYLLPLFAFALLLKSPWFKGVFGEFQVNLILKQLPKSDYHLVKNVTLPTDSGTTQIDHIVVSKFGVFVIETKNMKGWIFGSENQKVWTQKIFKHSSKFQNPLHQNFKHLKTLETLLGIDINSLFSVIVFIGDNKFKTNMPSNVTFASGCLSYIRSHTIPRLNQQQLTEITNKIESGRLERSFATDKKHRAHVREIIEQKKDEKTCPKCGSKMILREAKRGKNAGSKFWGCTQFPKCRAAIKQA